MSEEERSIDPVEPPDVPPSVPGGEGQESGPGPQPLGSPFAPEPGTETPFVGGPGPEDEAGAEGAAAYDAGPQEMMPALPPSDPALRGTAEVSDDDRLMAALAWISMVVLQIPLVSIVLLLSDSNRRRPFQRYHAVTSLMAWVAALGYEILAGFAYIVLTAITLGCLGLCLWFIFFVPHAIALWYTFQAYQGRDVEIPIISRLAREQGWV